MPFTLHGASLNIKLQRIIATILMILGFMLLMGAGPGFPTLASLSIITLGFSWYQILNINAWWHHRHHH